VQLIESESLAKNALDLVLAYHALCQKKLPDAEVERMFDRMVALEHIAVTPEGRVTHKL
jgi:hypothetical protein